MPRFSLARVPLLIAGGYALAGLAWLAVGRGNKAGAWDWAFFALTAPLLYWALRAGLAALSSSSEARFRTLVETSPDMVFVLDRAERILYLNTAAARALGGKPEDFLGRSQSEVFPPPTAEQHSRSLGGILSTGAPFRSEAPHEMAGHTVWIETHLAPIVGPQGTVQSVLGVARDITERRQAESELRRAYQHTAEILETIGDGWLSLDRALVLRSLNRAAEEILKRARGEVLGQPFGAAFPQLAGPVFEEKLSQAVRERRPLAFETHVSVKPYEDWYDVRVFPIQEGLSVFLRVTTDRKRLEAQLSQGQKMEAVGRLAGGVAHDFNNQLAAILGYSELILKDLAPEHPARQRAEQVRRAAERAATLTRQLLAFGRRQVLEPEMLDLNAVVSDLEELLRRTIGENIELVSQLAHDLDSVRADRAQVEQALLHLVVNAREAMPQGGRLTIETRAVTLDPAYCQRHLDARPGPHVMLAVTDTGCGMDRKTLERLFEPFFTTKAFGTGTGMGLSMVYGFVTQSGGHIAVESEVGHGSRFMLYLPCGNAAGAAARPAARAEPSPRGSETVLVVEDEPAVRRLIVDVLRAAGYRVIEAPNGDEGRKAAEAHEGPIHLLLTDVVMPRMSGQALAATLTRSRPGMRVLFMSGHAEEATGPQGVLDANGLLEKPFTPTTLVRRVHETLGGAPPAGAPGE